MLGTLFAYLEIRCGFAALSRVFLDAQAVDGAGKVRLRGAVFAHAALLEDGLLRLIGGALCTFGIDLFRVLGGVYTRISLPSTFTMPSETAAVRHSLPGAR